MVSLRRFWRALTSLKMVFFLIALLVVQILVTAVVPQRDISSDQLAGLQNLVGDENAWVQNFQLDRIYSSPVMYFSLMLLAINLMVGNVKRVRLVIRSGRLSVRGRHLGSVVFHMSLLLIIAGVLLNNQYKFEGIVAVTEGQTVRDVAADYHHLNQGRWRGRAAGEFSLTLDEVNRSFPVKESITNAASVRLKPLEGTSMIEGIVHTNHPLCWRDVEIHYGARTGYSPELSVQRESGDTIFKSFVRLKVGSFGGEDIHSDYMEIPGTDLRLEIRVQQTGLGDKLTTQVLNITQADSVLFAGKLARSDTLSVAGYRIAVPRVRGWCYLNVVRNPLLNMVFVGFWLALTGLTISAVSRVLGQRSTRHE